MPKDISDAVREVCLSFPEAEEIPSRGSPDFRVRGKTFATYVINHHGDGRLALWLHSPPGAQQLYTENEPEHYFVPPYVGPKGWLGVQLDKGISWNTIAERVREAYELVAPTALRDTIGATTKITPPTKTIDPEVFDPMCAKRAKAVMKIIDTFCVALPETEQGTQFGDPVWKAGKKTFVSAHRNNERTTLCFWVGADRQAALGFDDRYHIPNYIGHNGWIALDVEDELRTQEVEELLLTSYRHFALKRMLKQLSP